MRASPPRSLVAAWVVLGTLPAVGFFTLGMASSVSETTETTTLLRADALGFWGSHSPSHCALIVGGILVPMVRLGSASLIASIVLVGAACGGGDAAPPCTIGEPCQFSEGNGGTTYDGLPCVGEPSSEGCSCICSVAFEDGGVDGSQTPDSSDDAPEAGACGSGPPSACNQLANVGTVITPSCVAGDPPTMTGGPIADGTYVLVSGTAYTSTCSGVSLPTGGPTTIFMSDGCMQTIDVTGGAKTYTWTTSAGTLVMDQVCPGTLPPYDLEYTATPTTFSELAPLSAGISVVSLFQKQ